MLPIEIGKFDALKAFAFDVAPEADAGRACVGEGEIHPAVFVEVESDDADGGREIFFFEVDGAASGVNLPSRGLSRWMRRPGRRRKRNRWRDRC